MPGPKFCCLVYVTACTTTSRSKRHLTSHRESSFPFVIQQSNLRGFFVRPFVSFSKEEKGTYHRERSNNKQPPAGRPMHRNNDVDVCNYGIINTVGDSPARSNYHHFISPLWSEKIFTFPHLASLDLVQVPNSTREIKTQAQVSKNLNSAVTAINRLEDAIK